MSNEIKWRFPINDNGLIKGISDSGIETFKGTPYKSLAREICQNSLDARLSEEKPVEVVFHQFSILSDMVPGFRDLKKAIEQAAEFSKTQKSDKNADRFFKKALAVISAKKITCLRISDYNTTGLTGSGEKFNSPWINLVKAEGSSNKGGTKGGSFGIGKMAPYALSDIRTVIYSTYDQDGISASQGVVRLPSFEIAADKIADGIGFYGGEKNTPLRSQIVLGPDSKARSGRDFGTDIYILGFREDPEWIERITVSILDGFLYAIMNRSLKVVVQDQVIDPASLPDLMEEYAGKFDEHADAYYEVLASKDHPGTASFTENIDNLGNASLIMKIKPGFPRKAAMIRKTGMKIEDKAGISGTIPFAGVLVIEGDELNQFLRTMENPQHTKWEPDRAENKTRAKRVKSALTRFIKNSLKSLVKINESDSIDPHTGEFLSLSNDEQPSAAQKHETVTDKVDNTEIKYPDVSKKPKTAVVPPIKPALPVPGTDDQSSSDNGGGAGKRGGKGDTEQPGGPNPSDHNRGPHDGTGEKTSSKKKHSLLNVSQRIMSADRSVGKYRLFLTADADAENVLVDVYLSAENDRYAAALRKASDASGNPLAVTGNRISGISLAKGQRIPIDFWLDDNEPSAAEVVVYGIKI